jgi:hypothetical protein
VRNSLRALTMALLALPAPAAAQACLGVFTEDGTTTLEGIYSTTEGRETYGARGIIRVAGPLSAYATYDAVKFENFNEQGRKFGGGGALELIVPKISMCPVAGYSLLRLKLQDDAGAELTLREAVIPFGLAVGKVLPASESVFWVVYGQPEFQYIRSSVTFDDPTEGKDSDSDTENQFGFKLGMRIGWRWFYGGGGVDLTTRDETDPVFSLVGAILYE